MDAHQCGTCFETFDSDAESEYGHVEYITTAGHKQVSPDDLYCCNDYLGALCKVTDH